jgi:hypothetical protein
LIHKAQFFRQLLILLNINDLTENVQGSKLVLFADDTKLLLTAKDEFDLQHKIINVMRVINIVLKNNLIINTEKNICFHFISDK